MKELNVVDWASQRPPICLGDAVDKIKRERQTREQPNHLVEGL